MRPLPRLFIDTLELTIPVDEDQKQAVQDRLNDASEHWLDSLTSHSPQGRYAYRYKLEVPNGGTVTIKAGPARQAANYLKLEYKPDQVGANGASALAEYLSFVLGETYRDDFYLGNVNRIDITFDTHRVPIENYWVEDLRAGMKSSLIRGTSQQLETVYLGYKSRREFYVYDKRAETEGRRNDVSLRAPWVRFEYRYVGGDYPLGDLYRRLKNPYDNFVIRRYSPLPNLMEGHMARWLFDACRLRGKAQILGVTPENFRDDVDRAIKAFPTSEIWQRRKAIWYQLEQRIGNLLPHV